jgi:hypothetical protein
MDDFNDKTLNIIAPKASYISRLTVWDRFYQNTQMSAEFNSSLNLIDFSDIFMESSLACL